MVKNSPAKQEMQVRSLDQQDPPEKEMAMHSSILAQRISLTEEPGGLQSTGWQKSQARLSNYTVTNSSHTGHVPVYVCVCVHLLVIEKQVGREGGRERSISKLIFSNTSKSHLQTSYYMRKIKKYAEWVFCYLQPKAFIVIQQVHQCGFHTCLLFPLCSLLTLLRSLFMLLSPPLLDIVRILPLLILYLELESLFL